MELVYASVYDKAIEQVAIIQRRAEALETIVRFIAHTTPHEDKWEASYRALQDQARRTLVVIGVDGVEKTGKA